MNIRISATILLIFLTVKLYSQKIETLEDNSFSKDEKFNKLIYKDNKYTYTLFTIFDELETLIMYKYDNESYKLNKELNFSDKLIENKELYYMNTRDRNYDNYIQYQEMPILFRNKIIFLTKKKIKNVGESYLFSSLDLDFNFIDNQKNIYIINKDEPLLNDKTRCIWCFSPDSSKILLTIDRDLYQLKAGTKIKKVIFTIVFDNNGNLLWHKKIEFPELKELYFRMINSVLLDNGDTYIAYTYLDGLGKFNIDNIEHKILGITKSGTSVENISLPRTNKEENNEKQVIYDMKYNKANNSLLLIGTTILGNNYIGFGTANYFTVNYSLDSKKISKNISKIPDKICIDSKNNNEEGSYLNGQKTIIHSTDLVYYNIFDDGSGYAVFEIYSMYGSNNDDMHGSYLVNYFDKDGVLQDYIRIPKKIINVPFYSQSGKFILINKTLHILFECTKDDFINNSTSPQIINLNKSNGYSIVDYTIKDNKIVDKKIILDNIEKGSLYNYKGFISNNNKDYYSDCFINKKHKLIKYSILP